MRRVGEIAECDRRGRVAELKRVGYSGRDITAQLITKHVRKSHDEINIWGSRSLIPTRLRAELIDEFVLLTYPIMVGGGKGLLSTDTPLGLELTEATTAGSGVVICTDRGADSGLLSEWTPG